jgi:pimeloyl-ACP methyl ester carboxylesterase
MGELGAQEVRGAKSEVLPAARPVEIPGGGHDLTVEQPAALAEAVDRFLA